MKYLVALLICFISAQVQAGVCSRGVERLVEVEDITNCANQGDASAQFILGEIYFQGKEVAQNYKTAFDWVSKAAAQGDKAAQSALGFYYYNGWGTKKDHVSAYTWWSLSIVNNEEPVVRRNLTDLERELAPADLDRAQKLASDWSVRH